MGVTGGVTGGATGGVVCGGSAVGGTIGVVVVGGVTLVIPVAVGSVPLGLISDVHSPDVSTGSSYRSVRAPQLVTAKRSIALDHCPAIRRMSRV